MLLLAALYFLGLVIPQKSVLQPEDYARWQAHWPRMVELLTKLKVTSIYSSPYTVCDWPARLHAEVARRLGKRGLVPAAAEGPVAYLERAEQAFPNLARDLAAFRQLYVELRYGPLPTESGLRRLKHLVNRLRP